MKKILLLLLLVASPFCSFAEEEPKGPNYYLEQLEKEEPAEGSRFFNEFMNMLFWLAMIIGGLFLALVFFKRFINTQAEKLNEQSNIRVIEQRTLSPKTSLYLLEMGGQSLLIAESASGVNLLTKAPGFDIDRSYET